MRKILIILVVMSLLFTACTKKDAETPKAEESSAITDSTIKIDENATVSTEKGLLSVKITIPATLFMGADVDTVIEDLQYDDIDVTKNDDGSLTYKMSKATHKKMLDNFVVEFDRTIAEMVDEENEDYASIIDIKHNKTYSEITMLVEKEAYEEGFDALGSFSLGLMGMYYQAYNGDSDDSIICTVFVKDNETGELISTSEFPEAFNEFMEGMEDLTSELEGLEDAMDELDDSSDDD
ncbi:MAG: hypothetical protein KAQ68_06340 [Clostridiales bacterium]|nr:hypothetical protein [Clostridiales bacterium]